MILGETRDSGNFATNNYYNSIKAVCVKKGFSRSSMTNKTLGCFGVRSSALASKQKQQNWRRKN